MKKGRIILAVIALFAIAGGGLAFKAMRFTSDQVFTPTTIVFHVQGGVTYFITGNFCTTINAWIHPSVGAVATVLHLLTIPTTTLTLRQWPSGSLTTTLPFYPCVTTVTRVGNIM